MRAELIETAKMYSETQEQLKDVEDEIEELREETFGDDSEDTEEKARQLFDEVGRTDGDSSKTGRLDSLREEKERLRNEKTDAEEDLLELLVDIRFPLDETIQGNQPPIEFPFSESIDPAVLDAISDVMSEDMRDGEIEIQTDAIVVDTDSIDEAIEAVEHKVTKIRDRADANLDVPAQVEKIKDRDPKVAAMLYVLQENDNEPMTKSEMEDEIGLERGDLRGQLYYVLDNEPYLKKQEDGITLTPNGEKVIKKFVQEHGVPKLIAADQNPNSAEDNGDGGDSDTADSSKEQEVTAYE
jgi:hypothetical protein